MARLERAGLGGIALFAAILSGALVATLILGGAALLFNLVAPGDRSTELVILLAAAVMGLAGGVAPALWGRRAVARPVEALEEQLLRLQRGQIDALPEHADAPEIAALQRQLNHILADRDAQRQLTLQRLQDAERKLKKLFDSAEDAIFTARYDGAILAFNRRAERLFGYEERELLGKDAALLLPAMFGADPPHAPAADPNAPRRFATGAGLEAEATRKDGHRFAVECSISIISGGPDAQTLWIVRDITERKLQEANLEQIRAHLEQKVVERIAALSRTNKQLQQEVHERRRAEQKALDASIAKSRFLANMSHELRTPLNAIIGYAELIQEEAEEAGVHQFDPDLDRIRYAARHLLVLIKDILDLTAIEAGDILVEWASFDVSDLVDQLISTARPHAEKNGNQLFTVIGPGAAQLRSDPEKLQTVLSNLLSNACKFTRQGSVTLRVHLIHRLEGAQITFEVDDTGIGIDPNMIERLFETFTQADQSTTRRYEGTGLGLAIARRYARMLGGDISVTSELGRGSTFTVKLPLDGERAFAALNRKPQDVSGLGIR
jgi:PAS domain S-box-containing protein